MKTTKRGGFRPNSGRKKGVEKPGTITIRIKEETMLILDRVGKGNKSDFIESAIEEKATRENLKGN